MKMLDTWRSIRRTGTEGIADKELLHKIKLINSLNFSLCLLLTTIGGTYYILSGELSIIIPAFLEALIAGSAILLNYRKRYEAAALVTFLVQCAGSLYFGLLLANVLELQAMVILLFLITFLLFKEKKRRQVCLAIATAILVIIEANYYANFIRPIQLNQQLIIIFKALSIGGILLLILVVGKPYVLSNDQNNELTRANNFKRIFIYQTTHELRTQLNAIYCIAQLVKREISMDPGLKKTEPYINLLFNAVGNTRNIINNVLDMSKIEAGKMEDVQEESFELQPFFERLIAVHKVTARTRNIQIRLYIDEQMPPVIRSDSFKLSQIVANLLSNAVKYADRNSTVLLKLTKYNIHTWCIQVTNKGAGIAKEKLSVIFDQFVTDKQNRYTEGTGLGLYIVKNMVQTLGGNIQAESVPGGDTTFTIRLKLQRGTLEDIEGETEEDMDLSHLRVLVADDNEMNQVLFSQYLRMCGCAVTTASNGSEVISTLKNEKCLPDVILLDHQMPQMDGAATLAYIKRDPQLHHIPVIMCTGSFEFHKSLIDAGACAVLVKPIDQKSLFKIVSQHLPHINETNTDLFSEQSPGTRHAF
ncbi:hybrid sensor histidine kinase/response regulator [uncultured Chitinophaga sp.]|jgi:Signal transduction histidine kinase|uniref:hybrid sensor histidine kinase/response regulator n=1 Tax=uncultured Chitinophaga sp. TaxID=339340 RepID=UPI002637CC6B|nr:hybrid sensor histidine kinase/response regulator [uncultured Chitinophaga sp.]